MTNFTTLERIYSQKFTIILAHVDNDKKRKIRRYGAVMKHSNTSRSFVFQSHEEQMIHELEFSCLRFSNLFYFIYAVLFSTVRIRNEERSRVRNVNF